mgnify:CR=1 FL=1
MVYLKRFFEWLQIKLGLKNNNIIMPMIRKYTPHTIASQLVGVQPMAQSQGRAFRIKTGQGKTVVKKL